MKLKRNAGLALALVALAAVAFTLASCEEPAETMTVDECMAGFANAVNTGNYLGIKNYLHSGAGQYAQAGTAIFWSNYFSETGFSYTLGSNDTATSIYSTNFTFYLKEDGPDNYKIYQIIRQDAPIVTIFQ